jgi:hypothetical protein
VCVFLRVFGGIRVGVAVWSTIRQLLGGFASGALDTDYVVTLEFLGR